MYSGTSENHPFQTYISRDEETNQEIVSYDPKNAHLLISKSAKSGPSLRTSSEGKNTTDGLKLRISMCDFMLFFSRVNN